MVTPAIDLAPRIAARLRQRNALAEAFFPAEAPRLAEACREMAERFLRGGRLFAFGRGAHATDAQHVAVEFVHPIVVGKQALPALDLSAAFPTWLPALLRPDDIVMGFGPPGGDPEVDAVLRFAAQRGAQTFALPGTKGSYAVEAPSADPFVHQEMIEVLYHTLWETVHVFFEHRQHGHDDVGASSFLYPYLGGQEQDTTGAVLEEVAASILAKSRDDAALREAVARHQSERIAEAALAIHERLEQGGKLILFGNGGSATDANDWALDCVAPPPGRPTFPALSLAHEAATLSAVSNDVGTEVVFLRQFLAHAQPQDVAVGISTSGSSKNVLVTLAEARKRGLLTVALVGYDGGAILKAELADVVLFVPSDYIPRIQEVHASIYHTILDTLYDLADA